MVDAIQRTLWAALGPDPHKTWAGDQKNPLVPLVPEKLKDMIKNLLNAHLAENKIVHDFRLSLGFLTI